MDDDFPAAHSMDTLWFAVDAAGHVGVFDSDQPGHVPEGVEDATDVIAELWQRRFGHDDIYWEGEDLSAKLGVFYFEYDEDFGSGLIAPYRRSAVPESPSLHVDQLPPAVRQEANQLHFAGIDFASCSLVQPLEQVRCSLWSDWVPAYLCSDGKTIRPLPGMEDRFAEFCTHFRQANPEEAKKYMFEEVKEEPK
jgi:hypothetical protein